MESCAKQHRIVVLDWVSKQIHQIAHKRLLAEFAGDDLAPPFKIGRWKGSKLCSSKSNVSTFPSKS